MKPAQSDGKTYILGRGCIATTLAYYLDDRDLTLITRDAKYNPLTISYQGSTYQIPGNLVPVDSINFEKIERLIIPIKSYHNAGFLKEYEDKLPTSVTLVIFQNGIQFLSQFKTAFPNNPIIAGLTTDGAYRDSEGRITLAGKGSMVLGDIQHGKKAHVNQLINCHPDAGWINDIYPAIYKKLLVNIAINPLTFVYQCKNGELMNKLKEVNTIVEAVFSLFDALNIVHDKEEWFGQVIAVIKGTEKNRSSMLQDRINKQPTEIDAILGALIKKSGCLDAPNKPGNQSDYSNNNQQANVLIDLYQQVKMIENRYLSSTR